LWTVEKVVLSPNSRRSNLGERLTIGCLTKPRSRKQKTKGLLKKGTALRSR